MAKSIELKLSTKDLCIIGAACFTMSLNLAKNAESIEDIMHAAHLKNICDRINDALGVTSEEIKAVAGEIKAMAESSGDAN
jgi:hypothetical protein